MVDGERESGAFSDVPQVLCLDGRRSKGLGNDDVLSGLERSAAQLVVRRDRGRNGHGLDLGILYHHRSVTARRDTRVLPSDRRQTLRPLIRNRNQPATHVFGEVPHVVRAPVPAADHSYREPVDTTFPKCHRGQYRSTRLASATDAPNPMLGVQ